MRFTLNTSLRKQNVMPLDPDLLPSSPKTETEWMMQFGESLDDFNVSHIMSVKTAVEELDDKLRECIEAIFYERASYSRLAARLGVSKPHAWRLTKRAIAELQRKLINDSHINERYIMFEHWEDASKAVLLMLEEGSTAKKANVASLVAAANLIGNKVRDYKSIPTELFISVGESAIGQMKKDKTWDINYMHSLLIGKQQDYGHENILQFGLTGVAIRMTDKIHRLQTLLKNKTEPQNESLLDTWRDLVGYATIAQMLDINTFTLELKGETGE